MLAHLPLSYPRRGITARDGVVRAQLHSVYGKRFDVERVRGWSRERMREVAWLNAVLGLTLGSYGKFIFPRSLPSFFLFLDGCFRSSLNQWDVSRQTDCCIYLSFSFPQFRSPFLLPFIRLSHAN
jgi:hypothetical protein